MTELCKIAKNCGTDKVDHGYTIVYDQYFSNFRDKNIKLFEIGVSTGGSINTWKNYFPKSFICGMDKAEKGSMMTSSKSLLSLEDDRCKIFIGDQNERNDLNLAVKYFNQKKFDIIIDDGHHFQSPQQVSMGFLFPFLSSGGLYIIEDICTIWNMSHGSDWGQKDKNGLTDTTAFMLENFVKKGIWDSKYMLSHELEYIRKHTETVNLFYPQQQGRPGGKLGPKDPNSPITCASMLAIIRKK